MLAGQGSAATIAIPTTAPDLRDASASRSVQSCLMHRAWRRTRAEEAA